MPAPTRKIGPRIPTPEELKATELELAKLRNRVDDLDKTLDETREERDRLRAEVERLRPKENGEWRFFAPAFELPGCWAVRGEKGFAFLAFSKTVGEAEWCVADRREITAAEAYARIDDWPEGQRKFRELTGYEPVVKECLTTEPEERLRCYRSIGDPIALWVYSEGRRAFFDDYHDRYYDGCLEEQYVRCQDDTKRIPIAEALDIVRDRPKQLAKLKEMVGIEEPKEEVRCYRSKSGGVWVYGVQHNKYFSPYGDWNTAQPESTTIRHDNIRYSLAEARALLAGLPKSLAEFDRIVGWDEDREHLARLLAIPCKEMRV